MNLEVDLQKKDNRVADFIIIGAQKSGTTSLFRYLEQHPDIYMFPGKETYYFSNERISLEEYSSFFSGNANEKLLGEASPQYMYPNFDATKMHDLLPNIKLIAILRNPTERFVSHFKMNLRRAKESRSISSCIREEISRYTSLSHDDYISDSEVDYIGNGVYGKIIKKYISLYGDSKIKIFHFDDFKRDTYFVLDEISFFLNLKPFKKIILEKHNVSKQRKNITLYNLVTKLSTLSPFLNSIIKKIFGKNFISKIMFNWETKWSMSKNTDFDININEDELKKLSDFYKEDWKYCKSLMKRSPRNG